MDFLDPGYEKRHRIMLYVGYGLITLAIAVASLVALYLSTGYSLKRDGTVDQNGIVFVSSNPGGGASITVSGKGTVGTTNDRVLLASGQYTMQLSKQGYQPWQHSLYVQGGDVQRFTYVRMFPSKLSTQTVHSFAATPQFVSQSPDRRWLIIKDANTPAGFLEYDLRDPIKPILTEFALPDAAFTPGDEAASWKVVEWSTDNQHVLLSHTYTTGDTQTNEYSMLDRETPTKSQNLTKALSLTQTDELSLLDKRYDRFYILRTDTKQLRAIESSGQAIGTTIEHVRAFKSYGSDTLLYVSDAAEATTGTDAGQVRVILSNGTKQITLRRFPTTMSHFLLDIADYSNNRYVVLGSGDDKGVYIYRNPLLATGSSSTLPTPWRFLNVDKPTNVSFSSSAEYVAVQNSSSVMVYDAYRIASRRYALPKPLDTPQTSARWMDSDHITYVSDGTIVVFDYDGENLASLAKAAPQFTPFFSSNYSSLFCLSPIDAEGKTNLTISSLVVQ